MKKKGRIANEGKRGKGRGEHKGRGWMETREGSPDQLTSKPASAMRSRISSALAKASGLIMANVISTFRERMGMPSAFKAWRETGQIKNSIQSTA